MDVHDASFWPAVIGWGCLGLSGMAYWSLLKKASILADAVLRMTGDTK